MPAMVIPYPAGVQLLLQVFIQETGVQTPDVVCLGPFISTGTPETGWVWKVCGENGTCVFLNIWRPQETQEMGGIQLAVRRMLPTVGTFLKQ